MQNYNNFSTPLIHNESTNNENSLHNNNFPEGTVKFDISIIKNEFLHIKPSYNEINKNYKVMVKELRDMGFELEMIDMCFCFFNVTSLEQAVVYMTKENGIWQHNYIESENKLCVVCREYADHNDFKVPIALSKRFSHSSKISDSLINLRVNLINLKRESSSSSNLMIPEQEKEILGKCCGVCDSPIDNDNYHLKCNHVFCKDCWFFYLEEKIQTSEVINISCMMKDCNCNLGEEAIQFLTNEALFNKYKKFKMNKEVLTNDNMKFCPEVNCDGFGIREDEKFITCTNGHKFCFECLKDWHGKKKCEDVIDQDFEKWKKGKYIKQCPSCNFWTEKNEGCNHMTCRACSYQWCWLCTGRFSYEHYRITGPCYGLQFSDNVLYHNVCCRASRKIFYFIAYFLLVIAMIVGGLVFGSSLLSAAVASHVLRHEGALVKVFVSIVSAFAGFMFQPMLLLSAVIVLAFAILLFPFSICFLRKIFH